MQSMIPSPCVCYILRSTISNRIYIGFTVNFEHRLRQHNGEITGGAKRTEKFRPWVPVCVIQGFFDQSTARRFEYRLQHPRIKPRKAEDRVVHILNTLAHLITVGDGNLLWPILTIKWYSNVYAIEHDRVINRF